MEKAYRILAINPGSTSTKIAIFTNEEMTFSRELKHSAEDLKDFHHINDQLDFRLQAVLTELKKDGIALRELDAVVARGGNMKPVVGGTYQVNEEMLRDLEIGVMGQHASNLGGRIAYAIAQPLGRNAYVVDPVIVDELEKLPEVAAYYSVWNGLRDTLEGYYKNRPRQHNPLSQQKEFRAIKNAIIQEAERLRQQMEQTQTASEQKSSQEEEPSAENTSTDASANPTLANENTSSTTSHSVRLPSEYLLNSTVRLFHQVGQIFRDNAAPPSNPMGIRIDSKRRKKLMQKRLSMGHKQDDHEQNYDQTLQ